MRPVVVLCVLALVLSACGAAPRDSAKDFSGAKRDVAATVENVEDGRPQGPTPTISARSSSATACSRR